MNNQFSQDVQELLQLSREEAGRLKCRTILPEHLLLAMLRRGHGAAVSILNRLHADTSVLKQDIEEGMQRAGYTNQSGYADEEIAISAMATRIMRLSLLEARFLRSQLTDTEHVLLAILKAGGTLAAESLNRQRVDYPSVYHLISAQTEPLDGMDYTDEDDEEDDDMPRAGHNSRSDADARKSVHVKDSDGNQGDTPALDRFGVDLTLYAKEGKLDPVVGREREIDRVAQILGRRKKNNPILVGEAGVGKTAIVEGLALRIAEERVPAILLNKRIVMLDMSLVVAGTKFRGQFEERVCAILNELKQHDNIIVFIDEVHTLIGAGGTAGSMDAANMLKPALARGEMQCIGATTLNEYKKSIEKDSALERRFQKVLVEPSTAEETLDILHNIKQRYEEHHNVIYTEQALEACVKLTQRYISDRCFPDKAIDALDEAGSRMHLCHVEMPAAIVMQQKQIAETDNLRAEAVAAQNYELAASYRDKTKELTAELERMKADWKENRQEERQTVGEEEIAHVVSIMSGVPVQRVAQSEGVRLAGMKQQLQGKVIAQDAAIEKVTRAILRSRLGLKDPNRPIGTFLFLGPTGVGKTYLAQQLAIQMFGSKEALIRIDMSEYMEKFTVSRLIGAAPGYVGYEEGGQLTEKVRRHPYSIILLDEIEKAHPEVFNILLQVLDEGRLTDNNGRTIDFKNTIIILTSNVGTKQLKEFGRGVGFTAQSRNAAADSDYARGVIQKALHKTFSPEFLNRLDEIITFEQLNQSSIRRIVDLEIQGLVQRMEALGYPLSIDEKACDFLASKGYDVQFGARPLKRAIQNHLEDNLSEYILTHALERGTSLKATVNEANDGLTIMEEGKETE